MRLLRDLRESTRLLFLYEVLANRHTRLRTIAERLDMTVQGASDYLKGLEADGFLTVVDGEYRATKRGIEFLLSRVRELRFFVEQAGRTMAFVETTAALAGATIRGGDHVGLFMEDGHLVAYPNRASPSRGIADRDAAKAEDLAVRELDGIVALHPGKITIARVPPARSGGSGAVDPATARRILRRRRGAILGAMDVAGLVAARKLGLRPRIEFAVLAGALEAAERGVDVVLLVPEERATEAVQAIEAANGKLEEKIPYESLALR